MILPGYHPYLERWRDLLLCFHEDPMKLMCCPELVLIDFSRLWERSARDFGISCSQISHQPDNGIVGSPIGCLDSKLSRHSVHVHLMVPDEYLDGTLGSIWAVNFLMLIHLKGQKQARQRHVNYAALYPHGWI